MPDLKMYCGVFYPENTARESIDKATGRCVLSFRNGSTLKFNEQNENQNAYISSSNNRTVIKNVNGGEYRSNVARYNSDEENLIELYKCSNLSIYTSDYEPDTINMFDKAYYNNPREYINNQNIELDKDVMDIIHYLQDYSASQ